MVPQNIVHLILTEVFQIGAVDHTGLGVPKKQGQSKLVFETSNQILKGFSVVGDACSECSVLPGVDLADRDIETGSNVFHRLVALGDDAHTLCNGLGCNGVVTCHHDNLKYRRPKDDAEVRGEAATNKRRRSRRNRMKRRVKGCKGSKRKDAAKVFTNMCMTVIFSLHVHRRGCKDPSFLVL